MEEEENRSLPTTITLLKQEQGFRFEYEQLKVEYRILFNQIFEQFEYLVKSILDSNTSKYSNYSNKNSSNRKPQSSLLYIKSLLVGALEQKAPSNSRRSFWHCLACNVYVKMQKKRIVDASTIRDFTVYVKRIWYF